MMIDENTLVKFLEAAASHSDALSAFLAASSAHPLYQNLSVDEINASGSLGALLYVLTYHRLRIAKEVNRSLVALGELNQELARVARGGESSPRVDVNASDAQLM
jgi:hypothetical protein